MAPSRVVKLRHFQLLLLCAVVCSSVALALPPLEFAIRHRQAPDSPFRSPAPSLPHSIPLNNFLEFGLSRRTRRLRSTPAPLLANFSYLDSPSGDFYVSIPVGNPPQELVFILDTGSELSWTLCSPCVYCDLTHAPAFRFARSSSYKQIPCNSPLCSQSVGFVIGTDCNSSADSCVFTQAYMDGSADLGYMSVDDFYLDKVAIPVVFGCAVVDVETVRLPNSGILGLDAGPYSLPSQLSGRGYAKKFAYCLPNRVTNLNSSGLIRFGDSTFPTKLRYTPLVPPFSPLGSTYYYVGLAGISLGNTLLDIPASSFQPDEFGRGGTILDSGTVLSYLVEPIYGALVKAMKTATTHLSPFSIRDTGDDLCYNISVTATHLPKVPNIKFHLLDEVDLELEADSILYPVLIDENNVVICAAFSSAGSPSLGGINIIGNYQQQNYWIEYDLGSSSVGFAKANCALS